MCRPNCPGGIGLVGFDLRHQLRIAQQGRLMDGHHDGGTEYQRAIALFGDEVSGVLRTSKSTQCYPTTGVKLDEMGHVVGFRGQSGVASGSRHVTLNSRWYHNQPLWTKLYSATLNR